MAQGTPSDAQIVTDETGALDLMFHALADPTRRKLVASLSSGPATVSDLAKPFAVTLAAVLQHLRILEESGLITSEKQGRVRTCRLNGIALRSAEDWIANRRSTWNIRLERLARVLDES